MSKWKKIVATNNTTLIRKKDIVMVEYTKNQIRYFLRNGQISVSNFGDKNE